ncbi:MAG TPA: dTMP kinase [Candidatus Dormibacteraeota bacterium]|nr:dTMP kinase [Candidatus Dormibacteraeota bacterium]
MSSPRRGLFITFEGVEGSGKTTQAEMLGQALSTRDAVVVREPGGTELGEKIREMLLYGGMQIDAEAEMYLFMAARSQLIAEVIRPALEAGQVVVADRYHDSTLAYQGGGRGIATSWPPAFPKPDLTFLLALPVEGGRLRQLVAGKKADRVESEANDFHERVASAYEKLAAAEPQRFVVIDATGSRENVHSIVKQRVDQLLAATR